MSLNRRSLLKLSVCFGATTMATQLGRSASSQAAPSQAVPLTMQLDWLYNVQFAGLLLADHLGLYKQIGVSVNLKPWESGMIVPEVVAADPLTIGCSEQNLILAAQAQGAPLKAIATMFQASPYALMMMPNSRVQTPRDLVGKKVGIHADGVKVMALVKGVNGLQPDDIELVEIPHENKLERLISGEFDAMQCYAVDEPIGFAQKVGKPPVLMPMDRFGYRAYAQVFFATDTLLQQHPEQVRAFLWASFSGWKLALANIPATAKLVAETYAAKDSKYRNVQYQQKSLELVGQYVMRGIRPMEIGQILPERWQQTANLMAQYGIIDSIPNPEDSLDLSLWTGIG
jgi:NitT/TauT family transport system substrate-binding protein